MSCQVCGDACTGADLAPLLTPDLAWLWSALAAAGDRRGDERLTDGPAVTVLVPSSAAGRAAAAGLLGGRPLAPAQRRRIDLAQLTAALATRGPYLTPGAVSAHATGRRLAVKARAAADRADAAEAVRVQLETGVAELPGHVRERVDPPHMFDRLRSAGWLARILAAPDPAALLTFALAVMARLPLPDERIDRRILVSGDPHALDEGVLPALVLALTGAAGTATRSGWSALGVDCDDLLGGLITTGLVPKGWRVPAGATVTLPPRELANIAWEPPPQLGNWAFVTENPSVLAAATALLTPDLRVTPRVLCTAGTPSPVECQAIAALANAGWRIAARADFDAAGLAHVRAILAAAPDATLWRMGVRDYLTTDPRGDLALCLADDDAPWDDQLVPAMRSRRAHVYEEDLMSALLADIAVGIPEAGLNI